MLPTLAPLHLDLLGRLCVAAILGAAIGMERSLSRKEAGLRTHLLITLGAALLTDVSLKAAHGTGIDPLRVPAQIVSGLGFLGAGAIVQARGRVTGLTTAAGLWLAAGIGIATGLGYMVEAIGTTVFALVTLVLGARLERLVLARFGGPDVHVRDAEDDAEDVVVPRPVDRPRREAVRRRA